MVFRVDADGVSKVEHTVLDGRIEVRDSVSRVAIYVAANVSGEMDRIEARRKSLLAIEESIDFNTVANPNDMATLKELAKKPDPKP